MTATKEEKYLQISKEIADYVCDGTNDSNQINAAIQAAGTGKEIVLLDDFVKQVVG